ncbi:amidohydrolase [Fulvivirga sp. RKSG066]|uniref:amidohydrolase n=1 Tax=Fulvivirga aurantia TaxID=2529383 RepID=UPI0012BCBBA9|nr:amidohydrolase [Fulvivirga aurantia]MTI21591.1 amidohydrolase [Fulvivirga aurantia]
MKKYIFTIILACFAFVTQAQEQGDVLIKNGTVLTVTNGTLENTDVLIKDGKISKIGKGLKAPSGASTIDASGLFVMPGIIDAHSHIALDAVNEATSPVTAEVWTGDAIDPLDVSIYRALAGGVTISHAMHGSANAVGGQSETIKHRYGTVDPEVMKMKDAPRTIKFALGENPTRVHGGGNDILPRTRMGVEAVFRNSFSEAQEYMEAWDKYNANKGKKGYKGAPPAYDLRLETLADILKGEIIIHCHSYRADEIYMLMQVCKDFGVNRLVFQHVNEGFKVAPELAEFGAMASVFSDWWAYKFEVYYSTAYNATILTENNVVTSINSDSGELIRHLYHEAAKTQKYGGLNDDLALSLITINPAKQLGIEDRVGSIEEGKDGDIAIFKNHPLSIYTIPIYTLVDGVVKFDRENDAHDMRIYTDPEEKIDVTFHQSDHSTDRCMQDTEFLFKE